MGELKKTGKKQAVEYVGVAWPGLEGGFIAI